MLTQSPLQHSISDGNWRICVVIFSSSKHLDRLGKNHGVQILKKSTGGMFTLLTLYPEMTIFVNLSLPGNNYSQCNRMLIIFHKSTLANSVKVFYYSWFSWQLTFLKSDFEGVLSQSLRATLGHQEQDLGVYYWFEVPALHEVKACLANESLELRGPWQGIDWTDGWMVTITFYFIFQHVSFTLSGKVICDGNVVIVSL